MKYRPVKKEREKRNRLAPPRRIELPSLDRQSSCITRCIRRHLHLPGDRPRAVSEKRGGATGTRTPIPAVQEQCSAFELSPQGGPLANSSRERPARNRHDVKESNPLDGSFGGSPAFRGLRRMSPPPRRPHTLYLLDARVNHLVPFFISLSSFSGRPGGI